MKFIRENHSISHSRVISEKILDELLNLDFFVYSSHKSGTQTLVSSLNVSGVKASHIHALSNVNIKRGSFCHILDYYLLKNNKKMNVISIFRNPFERHISSFFQWHGTRPLALKEVKEITETLIFKSSIGELQDKFYSELRDQSLIGFSDSLHEIFQELGICADDLEFSKDRKYGIYETEVIKLYFLRHDIFFNEFQHLLSEIAGIKITQDNKNISDNKFYKQKYAEFKKTLSAPNDLIFNVYNSKSDLMKLFYDDKAESILSHCYMNFGRGI